MALEIRVFDANNVAQLRYDRIVESGDPGRIDLRIPLASLSPGAYTVRVVAGDGRSTAKAETGFIVRPR